MSELSQMVRALSEPDTNQADHPKKLIFPGPQLCRLDRSIPGFLTSRCWTITCAALRKVDPRFWRSTGEWNGAWSSTLPLTPAYVGHEGWGSKLCLFLHRRPPKTGCPILRALCEGWDKQNLRGRSSLAEPWCSTLRKKREGWGTRSLVVTEKRKDRPLMGLRPALVNPCTLVRGASRQSWREGRVVTPHPPVGRRVRWLTEKKQSICARPMTGEEKQQVPPLRSG
jgi:hypothetical protein